MSSRIEIGGREVKNPVAKAAIGIVAIPLALAFVLAVVVGTFAFVGVVLALSLGFVGVLLIALAVLIPVIIILSVVVGVISLPFRIFSRRGKK